MKISLDDEPPTGDIFYFVPKAASKNNSSRVITLDPNYFTDFYQKKDYDELLRNSNSFLDDEEDSLDDITFEEEMELLLIELENSLSQTLPYNASQHRTSDYATALDLT